MGNDQSSLSRDALNAKTGDSANAIRKKVIHGYQFRMKVVLRGDKNTGKTQLWNRLLGKGFNPNYKTTDRTQIGNITWDYQSTSDIINVEVWDLVDSTRKKKRRDGFKLSNADDDDDGFNGSAAGAAAIDPENRIYTTAEAMHGAAGVIFMFDPAKKWTWEYVKREVPGALATGTFVLIVANYRDCWTEGGVSELEARLFVTEQQSPNIYYTEASMKNAYGIKSIATFFTIPFMVIQRAWIEAELRRNEEELKTTEEELDVLVKDYTYETYMKQLADKKNALKRAQEEKKHEAEAVTEKKEETQAEEAAASKPVVEAKTSTAETSMSKKESSSNVKAAEAARTKKEKEDAAAEAARIKKERDAAEATRIKREKEEAKERARKEREEMARKAEEEKARKKLEKEAAELEKRRKKGPTKEELKKQKMEQESSIAQLKELSTKGADPSMTVDDVDDFKPDDGGLDDSFFKMGTKNDGWITTEPNEDVWGTGNIEDKEEDEEPQPLPKKGGKQKKKKKQAIILDDEDDI